MPQVTFAERYRTDRNFKRVVDDLQMEAIFLLLGLDVDEINEAWDGTSIGVTARQLMAKSGVSKPPTRKKRSTSRTSGKKSESKAEDATESDDE